MSTRVLITDDHPLTREGLAMAARAAVPGGTIDFAGTLAEAERFAATRSGYQLALLDLMLPDTRGFTGLLRLQFALGKVPIVVITASPGLELAGTARSLGAYGFLQKATPLDEVATALRAIIGGKHIFPPDAVASHMAGPLRDRIASLSHAQRRVLFALADGRLNKQIAGDLVVTEATIKAHMTAILRKLGVQNRMQAILMLQPLLGAINDETTDAKGHGVT